MIHKSPLRFYLYALMAAAMLCTLVIYSCYAGSIAAQLDQAYYRLFQACSRDPAFAFILITIVLIGVIGIMFCLCLAKIIDNSAPLVRVLSTGLFRSVLRPTRRS